MTAMALTLPTLETDRLILRTPRLQDAEYYVAYKMSARAKFTGGPIDRNAAQAGFFKIAGQWVIRGYGLFMATTRDDPETVIGGFGVFHPLKWREPEFGWTLYDVAAEGKGYVTEAMRAIIPWAWPVMGVDTAQSHIDEGNHASVAVARALGATLDAETTRIENADGGEFADHDTPVNIWRHQKGALK